MTLLVDGRTAMFQGLVDYAGLFPPASLDLDTAVAEYRTARAGAHAWMLGRFLCPTSRLEDLAAVLTSTMVAGEPPWRIGAVFDTTAAVGAAAAFHRHMEPAATIETVELRTPPEAGDGRSVDAAVDLLAPLADAAGSVAPTAIPFLEIDRTDAWHTGLGNAVDAVAELSRRRLRPVGAKLRTGGLEPAAFPTPDQVARFITACAARKVPFKMTAGLHHPVRHRWEQLDVMRHGFLNLLVASALAVDGVDETEVVLAVAERDPDAFEVRSAGVTWNGHRIGVPALRRMRAELFPAYGSCSFDEPVADLEALGLLEAG